MRKLTEKQAWRKIARHIVENGGIPSGLCEEVRRYYCYNNIITGDTSSNMHRRIRTHLDTCSWAYPTGEEYYEARTLAALWMALEAEEEN